MQDEAYFLNQGNKLVNMDSILIKNVDSLGLQLQNNNFGYLMLPDTLIIETNGFLKVSNCHIPVCIDTPNIFDCQGTFEIDP